MNAHATRIRSDCPRCKSTGSVEFGICQLCLAPSAELTPDVAASPRALLSLDVVAVDEVRVLFASTH